MGITRTLDSHAFRLRKKLNARRGGFVVNVWGVGYRLIDGGIEVSLASAAGGWFVAVGAYGRVVLAQRALDARMEAVARACHELRGPITAALLGLELGRRRGLRPAQLAAIHSELRVRRSHSTTSRTRRRRARPRARSRRSTSTCCWPSVRAWRPAAAEAGSRSSSAAGRAPRVRGDPLRLAQATGNLIANAIEHGGRGVSVSGRRPRPVRPDRGPGPRPRPVWAGRRADPPAQARPASWTRAAHRRRDRHRPRGTAGRGSQRQRRAAGSGAADRPCRPVDPALTEPR